MNQKGKSDTFNYIKNNHFCSSRDIIQGTKRPATCWQKTFATYNIGRVPGLDHGRNSCASIRKRYTTARNEQKTFNLKNQEKHIN